MTVCRAAAIMDSDTWQQQLDELVALQSIYGEDDFRWERCYLIETYNCI